MKNAITNFLKRFKDKDQAFRVSELAGALRDFAVFKANRQMKKPKSDKKPYKWGKLGAQQYKYPEIRYEQKPSVIKQFQKSEAYKVKINSKKWKKAAKEARG